MKKESKVMKNKNKIPEKRKDKMKRYLAGLILIIIGSLVLVITYYNNYAVYELYLIAIMLIAGGIGLIVSRNPIMIV